MSLKFFFYFAIFLLFISTLYASNIIEQILANHFFFQFSNQPGYVEDSYVPNYDPDYKVILKDHFNNNSNDWLVGEDSTRTLKIENGKMIFEHKEDWGAYHTMTYPIFVDGEFGYVINATFQHLSGKRKNAYGLTWSYKNLENYYTFNISANGYYRIGKMQSGIWETFVEWTKTEYIETGGKENHLTIIEYGDKIDFLINLNHVETIDSFNFIGAMVGFVIWKDQKIKIDDLYIATFDDTSLELLTE